MLSCQTDAFMSDWCSLTQELTERDPTLSLLWPAYSDTFGPMLSASVLHFAALSVQHSLPQAMCEMISCCAFASLQYISGPLVHHFLRCKPWHTGTKHVSWHMTQEPNDLSCWQICCMTADTNREHRSGMAQNKEERTINAQQLSLQQPVWWLLW